MVFDHKLISEELILIERSREFEFAFADFTKTFDSVKRSTFDRFCTVEELEGLNMVDAVRTFEGGILENSRIKISGLFSQPSDRSTFYSL